MIDILDFAELVCWWGARMSGDTTCGRNRTHADINADGVVDLLDYSFISMNFAEQSQPCCCGTDGLGNTEPLFEVTVAQLRERGLSRLRAADLNGDGRVNLSDMAALMQGVRPRQGFRCGAKDVRSTRGR